MFVALIVGLILLWKLQSVLLRKCWSNKLSVKLEFIDRHIYEGDESTLKEVVINDKHLPVLAVDVRLAISRNLKFISNAKENSTISDQTYKRDVFSFLGRQQITRKLRFVGEKRGLYEFSEVDVSGYDFFLRYIGRVTLPQDVSLFVYPKIVSAERINLICQDISGMVISQVKLNPDPFEFYGIREYVNTDPMNHINWKASARTDTLMVNQFDSTTTINLQILLELEDLGIWKKEELQEESIRIAAALASRIVSKNMPVTLVSNALDYQTDEMIDIYMAAGGGNVQQMNEKLACIQLDEIQMAATEFIKEIAQNIRDRGTYILISKNYTEEVLKSLSVLAQKNVEILWIMPQYAYEEPVVVEIPGVKLLRWEVAA